MRLARLAALALLAPVGAFGQVSPTPGSEDPRIQTVSYDPLRPVRLVAFPLANLTVMLPPGERIERATLSDPGAFSVSVTGSADSLNITSLRPDAAASLEVETGVRHYAFDLATGEGLAAAYVVRFVAPTGPPLPAAPAPEPQLTGEYRLTGERSLLPARIGDDGERTYIEWGRYQSLPAVFGIGGTGTEEVVDGYMRAGVFTIDRVYPELVFRVDRKRARAQRRGGLEG